MFDGVAARYDLVNDLLTGGLDRQWRRAAVAAVAPLPGERILDLAAGTGTSSKPFADAGALVVPADLSLGMLQVGKQRLPGLAFVNADALALPFADGAFDAVNVTLVLEHLDDLDTTVAEIARVLAPGGRLALFLNHPLLQAPEAAWVVDHTVEPPERSWRIGGYLTEQSFVDQVARGVEIRFVHRPLGRYVNALLDAGLVLRHMEEPAPPPGFLAQAPEYVEQADIPRLLLLRAEKPTG